MKQDMIVILDLGSTENTTLARAIRDLGVYSEIYPHDITPEELKALPNVKGVVLNGGENRVVDGHPVDVDPALYQCGIPMLAVALSLLACLEMGALAFGKARTGVVLFLCLAGAAFDLMALADGLPLADTALYLGMAFYLLSAAGALADNDARADAPPPCAAHCAQCAGCAPMGTVQVPEKKKKGKSARS